MKRTVGLIVICVFIGLLLGLMESSIWLKSLGFPLHRLLAPFSSSAAGLLVMSGLISILILITAYIVSIRFHYSNPFRNITMWALSLGLGGGAYIVLSLIAAPVALGRLISVFFLALGFAAVPGLLFWLINKPSAGRIGAGAKSALVFLFAWTLVTGAIRAASYSGSVPALAGFNVFSLLSYPITQRLEPSVQGAAFAGASLGLLVYLAWTFINKSRMSRNIVLATSFGAITSTAFCVSHLIQFAQVVGSGYAPRVAFISAVSNSLAVVFSLSLSLVLLNSNRKALILLPLAVYSAGGLVYIDRVHDGSDLYIAATCTYSYRTNVYIHYLRDGGWRRTSDVRSDDIKLLMYDRLFERYPHSMYRADALVEKAVAAFNNWDFDESIYTLQRLHENYPGSRGTSWILLYVAYLASGQPSESAHIAQSGDWIFHSWLAREGSRLAALSYEDLGLRGRATGYYSTYLNYLQDNVQGAWVTSASQTAEDAISELQAKLDAGKPELASVTGRFIAPRSPSGIRVALVDPQIDASSPADSMQFTGPRTIPLWRGRWAASGKDGRFTIRNVPYGIYDLVVGFDAATAPEGCVLTPVKSPVVVKSPIIELKPISFAKKVDLTFPREGMVVEERPLLSWKPYSGASSYSVSVITPQDSFRDSARGSSAYTCWSMSGIKEPSIRISASGFQNAGPSDEKRTQRLIPGRSYMWVVYACDPSGRIISSSEHYRLDHEPVFSVKSNKYKNKEVEK